MVSSVSSIFLTKKGNSEDASGDEEFAQALPSVRSIEFPYSAGGSPFLRVPPFPGAAVDHFTELQPKQSTIADIAGEARRLRVGGTYWAAQPEIPADCILVRCPDAIHPARKAADGRSIVLWARDAVRFNQTPGIVLIKGDCDPWHVLSKASALVAEPGDELRIIAGLLGVPSHLYDEQGGGIAPDTTEASDLFERVVLASQYENPFTGEPMTAHEAVELCGFWRKLIDSNRDVQGGIGFAFWKQDHVAPLLWDGSRAFRFLRSSDAASADSPVAVWRSKTAPAAMSGLERMKIPLFEVEDGFLRSRGLGADCIPPLSITVDRLGAHFDPSSPSELEILLQNGQFDDTLLKRAREVRRLIVEAGIAKYERGIGTIERRVDGRRHILVPGQVEDDRAVVAGGCGLVSNLDLLARVREHASDAYILYKPHPDVIAGHRRGAISEADCLRFADEIVGDFSIASLIEMVDEVHVNTSLAGFEALLRGKEVTTHGVPFYSGWGLTRDLGPVPLRRSTRRTVDELVAATLLLYPRYFDPVTGLPCPAEVVIARLGAGEGPDASFIVGMRRLQGKLMRRLRELGL